MTSFTPQTIKVGDGAAVHYWSDTQSHTVIEVRRNGRQIVLQRDKAVRTNRDQDTFSPGGFVGHTETPGGQKWELTPDTDGATKVANWSAKRERFMVGGPKGLGVSAGRYERYDYNF
jgi:hypothetical protein